LPHPEGPFCLAAGRRAPEGKHNTLPRVAIAAVRSLIRLQKAKAPRSRFHMERRFLTSKSWQSAVGLSISPFCLLGSLVRKLHGKKYKQRRDDRLETAQRSRCERRYELSTVLHAYEPVVDQLYVDLGIAPNNLMFHKSSVGNSYR